MNRTELQRAVDSALGRMRAELVENTSRILQFESVSGSTDPAECARQEDQMRACGAFLRQLTERLCFRWIESPGRWYCVEWPAERARDTRPPLVLGIPTHIDVVPAGGTWIFPPFSGAVADGAIWGRGAVDMKGPLMACLYALVALRESGFRPPMTTRLIIGTREEINDWVDIDEYLAQEGAPDFGFTPDACFPVVTGEKGTLTVAARATWSAAAPAAGIEPVLLRGGSRANVVPDFCELVLQYPRHAEYEARRTLYAVLARFEMADDWGVIEYSPDDAREVVDGRLELRLVFQGRSAHGSTPEKGHNAALDALRFLMNLETGPGAFQEFARVAHLGGADWLGHALGLASTHEFLGPTTVNLGTVRIEPGRGEVVYNVRPTLGLSTGEARRRIEDRMRGFAPEAGLAWEFARISRAQEPLLLDVEALGPFLRGVQEGFTAATGQPAPFCSIPYTTYAKAFANCCAFGPILYTAGEEELAHQPDERVSIEALIRNTRIFALALAFAGMNLAR